MHKRIAPLLAVVVGVGLSSSAASAAPAERAAGPKTIVGVAASDKRFTTLVTLVTQAGLVQDPVRQGAVHGLRADERRVREAEEDGACHL